MQGTLGRAFLGFIAAAVAVLAVHQTIIYALGLYGMTRSVPWTMRPLGYGPLPWLPITVNSALWGGLWGIVFALIYDWLPGGWSPGARLPGPCRLRLRARDRLWADRAPTVILAG